MRYNIDRSIWGIALMAGQTTVVKVREARGQKDASMKAIDFFCGAGGMSYGLQSAGIRVLAGIDNSKECRDTYTANVVGARFIKHDISTLSAPELGRRLNLKPADPDLIFAGCSPCQFWSKIRTDKTRSQRTAQLLRHFQKFVRHFLPGFVLVENVPGLYRRKKENILPRFLEFLDREGYVWSDGIVNANHYGVPQRRMRYLLLATRLSDTISLPEPEINPNLTVDAFIGVKNGFQAIAAGHQDPTPLLHSAAVLSPKNLKRISLTKKSGGNRMAWCDDPDLQIPAYEGRNQIFRDVYGRMYWDKPAPTITTRFNSLSNGRFGHPDEDRAISIREGATLQTFPLGYRFHVRNNNIATRQIGNAVPPEMARRIGSHILALRTNG
jgi:DNA (cytosine-5)-methyltransferase 1